MATHFIHTWVLAFPSQVKSQAYPTYQPLYHHCEVGHTLMHYCHLYEACPNNTIDNFMLYSHLYEACPNNTIDNFMLYSHLYEVVAKTRNK